ncbi:hypothetical protein [Achromobacter sp.]|uniref:hypothetical protein n=1 Tax=Achromobacter sp. TaxID=134375 RepID=UPI0028A25A32|nr:hypothetical protein [Achromobacter sp.]
MRHAYHLLRYQAELGKAMTASVLLQFVAIGVIAGALGQGIRAIVGIKKASDEVAAEGSTLRSEGLDVSRLVLSVFIGGTAGGVGIFTITGFHVTAYTNISVEMFFGVVGIGYAGTDFIEGFVRTQLPNRGAAALALSGQAQRASPEIYIPPPVPDLIKQSCERLLRIPANASDCSGFAKAVAAEFGVTMTGLANDIADQLTSANGWTELGSDAQAGRRAAEAAARGEFVIGARKEVGNGHVVVVVEGMPLAHDKYPFCYWGKLNDPANAGFNRTANWAWDRASRDSVTYASRKIS